MNIFRSTLRVFITASLTLMVASIMQGIAQTNIPADQYSVVTGTFKAGPTTVVKGENAEGSYLSTAVNIASTVRQVVEGTPNTNSSGYVTRKDSFKKYAFGNKEILQLSLSTNKITGYALAYTNTFANNPFDSGAFVARNKTNNVPATLVAFYSGEDVYAEDINRKTDWSIVKKYNYDGYLWFAADIGSFTNLPVFASYKIVYPKIATFGVGTNKTTDFYSTIRVNGSFSGIVPAAD